MPTATINRVELEAQLNKLIADYKGSFLLSVFGTESHQAYLDRLLTRDANLTQLKAYLAKHDQRFGLWRSLVEIFWPTAQRRASLCLYELQRLSQDLANSSLTPDSLTERVNFIETQARRLSYWSRLRLPLQAWLNSFKNFLTGSSSPSAEAPTVTAPAPASVPAPVEAAATKVPTKVVASTSSPREPVPSAAMHYDYPRLQLNHGATAEQIKTAYRKAALRCHPDKPGGSHAAFTELNQEFARISGLAEREQTDFCESAAAVNYEELIKAFQKIEQRYDELIESTREMSAQLDEVIATYDRIDAGIAELKAIRARKKERAARRAAKAAAAAERDAGLGESKLNSSKAASVAEMATSESEPLEPATVSFKL